MSGVVVDIGSAVASAYPAIEPGAYVAILGANSCFAESCAACAAGHSNLCREYRPFGLGSDGAWAQYVAVRASSLVPVPGDPSTLPPAIAAIATDALLTPYHALKSCCRVQPGQTVLCLGAGGLGLNAIAIAKNCLGAGCVIACDKRQSSLTQALDMGADHAVPPDELVEYISEKKLAVNVAVDFVGTQATFDTCLAAVTHGGIIHIIGLPGPAIQLLPVAAMLKDLTVKVSYWGRKDELVEVLQACV